MKNLLFTAGIAAFALALVAAPQANADSLEVRLGQFVSRNEQESGSPYTITSVTATAFASTEAGRTLAVKGCYAKREDTGQGFPYRWKYWGYHSNSRVETRLMGDRTFVLTGLAEAEERARKAVKDQAAWYCACEGAINVELQAKLERTGRTVNIFLTLQQDEKGYYVEKPYGRVYVATSTVDVSQAPGGLAAR